MTKKNKTNLNKPANRMVRDYFIWDSHENLGKSSKEIAAELGISQPTVSHVLKTCEMIERLGDIGYYFDLGIEIADVLDNAGIDPDKCTAHVIRALWVEGFNTRAKIAAMTEYDLERVCGCRRMRRAGYEARDVFLTWQSELAAESKKPAKKPAKTKKTAK